MKLGVTLGSVLYLHLPPQYPHCFQLLLTPCSMIHLYFQLVCSWFSLPGASSLVKVASFFSFIFSFVQLTNIYWTPSISKFLCEKLWGNTKENKYWSLISSQDFGRGGKDAHK